MMPASFRVTRRGYTVGRNHEGIYFTQIGDSCTTYRDEARALEALRVQAWTDYGRAEKLVDTVENMLFASTLDTAIVLETVLRRLSMAANCRREQHEAVSFDDTSAAEMYAKHVAGEVAVARRAVSQ